MENVVTNNFTTDMIRSSTGPPLPTCFDRYSFSSSAENHWVIVN